MKNADERAGDRLQAFSTWAEERWLCGTGPQPVSPADRLPERAPVLLPRAGLGGWIPVARTARAWVTTDGALTGRDPTGAERVLVTRGQALAGWWVIGRASSGAGLPDDSAGWLVIAGAAGPLTALRLADWRPGWTDAPASAPLMQAAGAEAVCRALGVTLEPVTDPAQARRRVGTVPREARFELDARLGCSGLAVMLAVLLVAGGAITEAFRPQTALAIAVAAGLAAMPLADLAAWRRRRRRVRRLPGLLDAWWAATPAAGPVPGRGLGVRNGPGGPELVLADGHGGESWLAGPGAGGAAGIAGLYAEPGAPPWGLLLYDRGERLLTGLRAADWTAGAGGPGGLDGLTAGGGALGLAGPAITTPEQQMMTSRDRALRARDHADVWTSLAATRLTLCLSFPIGVGALGARAWGLAAAVLGWAVVVAAVRALGGRRVVL